MGLNLHYSLAMRRLCPATVPDPSLRCFLELQPPLAKPPRET